MNVQKLAIAFVTLYLLLPKSTAFADAASDERFRLLMERSKAAQQGLNDAHVELNESVKTINNDLDQQLQRNQHAIDEYNRNHPSGY